jgi:hypothetical protein
MIKMREHRRTLIIDPDAVRQYRQKKRISEELSKISLEPKHKQLITEIATLYLSKIDCNTQKSLHFKRLIAAILYLVKNG